MSERHVYEKETLSLFEKSQELENEFVITEKGIQYPVLICRKVIGVARKFQFFKYLILER